MACVAATLWGTWPLYVRGQGVTGVSLAFLTLATMALPAPFVFRRAALADIGATIALVIVGLADAANVVLYFTALERGPIVVATLTHYLAPLLVALFTPWVLDEPRSRRALLAAPLVLLGLGMVLSNASTSTSTGTRASWGTTAALGGGSALFYATLVIASRRAGRSYAPAAIMSLHSVVSAVGLAVVFGREVLPTPSSAVWGTMLGACVNGLFAGLMFNRALIRIGAQLTSVLTYLEPLTAALVGVLVFAEPAGALTLAGSGLVLGIGAWAARE